MTSKCCSKNLIPVCQMGTLWHRVWISKGFLHQAISALDFKFFIHILLIVRYKKVSCTMKADITHFLLISIMWKTVKWIEHAKDRLYQHQIWYTASGDGQTHFYYKWARLVKKHGRHGPMYFCNGRGLWMIGHNSHTLCPVITKLGG